MYKFASVSVVGGWQSAVFADGAFYAFGPVFNKCTDLWVWQAVHLARQ